MSAIHFIIVAPGHFHAALIQKAMLPGVAPRVAVYAPLDGDLLDYLQRIAQFNSRAHAPTSWELDIRASADYRERFLHDQRGNAVIFSGGNRGKIDLMLEAVEGGLHILADKPWIIDVADFPKVEALLNQMMHRRVIVMDMMTERYEITTQLQRELVQDRAVLGELLPGTAEEPSLSIGSVHFLQKEVAGQPLKRPATFFDIYQQGEGLADVGTHLVDLVMWLLLPEQVIDYRRDIVLHDAQRWATVVSREQFRGVTGLPDFPAWLAPAIRGDSLHYFCNNAVDFSISGYRVGLHVQWDYASSGSDLHWAVVRGSRSCVDIRQGTQPGDQPELWIVPHRPADQQAVHQAVQARIEAWQDRWPGVVGEDVDGAIQLRIPPHYRLGHEAHFAEVLNQFLQRLANRSSYPAWEVSNLLAKYSITTKAVAMARQQPAP